MTTEFERARQITLERLDEIFGHETAHLEQWQQFSIAAEAFMRFANITNEIAEEMRTIPKASDIREGCVCGNPNCAYRGSGSP